jgi:metal-responsive CopG/Arc/MetJ family transcriptional regulator
MGKKEDEAYRLNPNQFPRRIELELPEKVLEKIQKIAKRTGRSFSEVATGILSRGVEEHPTTTD